MKNPVAKNCRKFNKAVVHVDQKKAAKAGKVKHKQNYKESAGSLRSQILEEMRVENISARRSKYWG